MHANPVKNGRRNIQKIDRRASCRGQHSEAEMIGGVEADGSGTNGGGRGAGAWRLEAHDLRLEGEVRKPRREREVQRLRQLKDGTHRLRNTSTQSWYRDQWDEDCGAEQVILRLGNAGPPESVTLWAGEYDYHRRSRGSLP